VPLTRENAAQVWDRALEKLSGMVVEQARRFCHMEVPSPTRLVIAFRPEYSVARSTCQRQVQQFERALGEVTGQRITLEFILTEEPPAAAQAVPRPASPQQRLLEVSQHPLVSRAGELFGAQPLRVEEPSD
jgi:hypothetical protein